MQMVNLVSERQNNAIMALAQLQLHGITENQTLNACKLIETNCHNLNGAQSCLSSYIPNPPNGNYAQITH